MLLIDEDVISILRCINLSGAFWHGFVQLDDWVLCRIYKKKSTTSGSSMENTKLDEEREDSGPEENAVDSSSIVEDFLAYLPEIETSKANQLHLLPKLEETVNSTGLSLQMDTDLQSTGSVVMDHYSSDDYEVDGSPFDLS